MPYSQKPGTDACQQFSLGVVQEVRGVMGFGASNIAKSAILVWRRWATPKSVNFGGRGPIRFLQDEHEPARDWALTRSGFMECAEHVLRFAASSCFMDLFFYIRIFEGFLQVGSTQCRPDATSTITSFSTAGQSHFSTTATCRATEP